MTTMIAEKTLKDLLSAKHQDAPWISEIHNSLNTAVATPAASSETEASPKRGNGRVSFPIPFRREAY